MHWEGTVRLRPSDATVTKRNYFFCFPLALFAGFALAADFTSLAKGLAAASTGAALIGLAGILTGILTGILAGAVLTIFSIGLAVLTSIFAAGVLLAFTVGAFSTLVF